MDKMRAVQQAELLLRISKLKFPKYPNHYFPVFMLLKYIKIKKSETQFDIVKVPSEFIEFIAASTNFHALDTNNCIILNEKFHRSILSSSEYVHLCPEEKSLLRIAQVLPGDCIEIGANEILVSENANFPFPTCTIKPIDLNLIPLAREVEIALITIEQTISNQMVNTVMRNYFQNPKLVHKNDIICVNTRKYASEFFYTSSKINETQHIYFKCNKIVNSNEESESLASNFCIFGKTTLNQSTDVQSFLPKQIDMAIIPKVLPIKSNYKECLLQMCPFGLENYLTRLITAIKPFLQKRKLPLNPIFLLRGPEGSGKQCIIKTVSLNLGLKICKPSRSDLNAQSYAQIEIKLRNAIFKAKMCAPCLLILNNIEDLSKNNEGNHDPRVVNHLKNELNALFKDSEQLVIVICASASKDLHSDISRMFLEAINIDAPDQECRESLLGWFSKFENLSFPNIANVASKTNGFFYEDLKALVNYAKNFARFSDRAHLLEDDFEKSLDLMQNSYVEAMGAPKVPKVQWSDVGGLENVKEEIIKTISLPLKHPELLKIGIKRSGVLLYGPPGTGKTLLAKAVATECALCFLSVKGPELLNMYVGQSEQNVREVFEKARQAAPCIIFFDELDSLAPNRGISGDSGGVMDRVVSQLLSEMDGLNESATIFIIGATNRPDLIDPALLRPGRFDKLLYVGPCTDVKSKVLVMKALTKKFCLSEKLNLEKIVKSCASNITGADLYGICSSAWMRAASRTVRKIEKGKMLLENTSEKDVVVTAKDFEEAIKSTKPSVSRADMEYFDKLQKDFK